MNDPVLATIVKWLYKDQWVFQFNYSLPISFETKWLLFDVYFSVSCLTTSVLFLDFLLPVKISICSLEPLSSTFSGFLGMSR